MPSACSPFSASRTEFLLTPNAFMISGSVGSGAPVSRPRSTMSSTTRSWTACAVVLRSLLLPRMLTPLYNAARNGQWDAARAEQQRLTRLFTIIEVPDTTRIGPISAALGAFKAALKLRGVIAHAGTAPPLLPLLPAEVDKVAAVMADAGIPGKGRK